MDNKWVFPYNRDLLVKYQCHINMEICCHARSIKYLFNYCLKGHDRATVEIKRRKKDQSSSNNDLLVDEIKQYFNGRYIYIYVHVRKHGESLGLIYTTGHTLFIIYLFISQGKEIAHLRRLNHYQK